MKKNSLLFFSIKYIWKNARVFFVFFLIKTIITNCKVFVVAYVSKCLFNEIFKCIQLGLLSVDLIKYIAFSVIIDFTVLILLRILDFFSEISVEKYRKDLDIKNITKCYYLKISVYDDPQKSNELKQFFSDSGSIMNLYCQFISFICFTCSFVVSIIIGFKLNVFISLLAIIISLPTFFVKKKNSENEYDLQKKQNGLERLIAYFKSVLTQKNYYSEVHINNNRDFFIDKINSTVDYKIKEKKSVIKKNTKRDILIFVFFSFMNLIVNSLIIVCIIYNKLTIGDYTYYSTIIGNLKNSAEQLISIVSNLVISKNKVKNYTKYLYNLKDEINAGKKGKPDSIEEIEFVHVFFKYPNSSTFVLNDICLKIKANEKIAIAGINGAGKTTLINLLLRLYQPTSGSILINGININDYKIDQYWEIFSCMFQQSLLYNISLRENLLMAINKPNELSDEYILKKLHLVDFDFDDEDLNKQIGKTFDKDGLIFSNGQSQKIILERTLFKETPILLFDEPSSSMDANSEDLIMRLIFENSKNKTLLLISHRLSNLKKMDRIVFLNNNKIAELGTHEDLMKNKGKYYELYNMQSSKY